MVVLKTLFKWIVLPILALLIIISLSLVVTGNCKYPILNTTSS